MKAVHYNRRKVLKAKSKKRKELAKLPFEEKIKIVKKLKTIAKRAKKSMKTPKGSG